MMSYHRGEIAFYLPSYARLKLSKALPEKHETCKNKEDENNETLRALMPVLDATELKNSKGLDVCVGRVELNRETFWVARIHIKDAMRIMLNGNNFNYRRLALFFVFVAKLVLQASTDKRENYIRDILDMSIDHLCEGALGEQLVDRGGIFGFVVFAKDLTRHSPTDSGLADLMGRFVITDTEVRRESHFNYEPDVFIVRRKNNSSFIPIKNEDTGGFMLASGVDLNLEPRRWGDLPTNLQVVIPEKYNAVIRSIRCGHLRPFIIHQDTVFGADDNLTVKVYNTSGKMLRISAGDAIGELVFSPKQNIEMAEMMEDIFD